MPGTTPTTITVSSNSALKTALQDLTASGGGTILLENTGSSYTVSASLVGPASGRITITSADPNNPAVIDGVMINASKNIAFENLMFDSRHIIGRDVWIRDLVITNSTNISFSDSVFRSMADGMVMSETGTVRYGENLALIENVSGFVFENNTVSHYRYGLSIADSNDIIIRGNEFSHLQADGINGGGWQNVLIEGNHFHDWYGTSNNHDDMIQIWGTNAKQLTRDVTIRDNFFDAGEGAATQTIHIKNEWWGSPADNYKNITVENNVIYNGHNHGIAVYDSTNVSVLNNTLLWNSQARFVDGYTAGPGILVEFAEGAVVTGNIAGRIWVEGTSPAGNQGITYFTASSENYVGKHFINALAGGHVDLMDLQLRPDSAFAGLFGASASQPDLTPTELTAVIAQNIKPGEVYVAQLDAGLSRDSTGLLDETEADFQWILPGGEVLHGQQVEAVFKTPGRYQVELVVTDLAGNVDRLVRTIQIKDPVIIDMDFESGLSAPKVTFHSSETSDLVAGLQGKGLHMDGSHQLWFDMNESGLFEAEQFSLSLAFAKDAASGAGNLINFTRNFNLDFKADGSMVFSLSTQEGYFTVKTAAGVVADTEWHKVHIVYNSFQRELQLWLDGELVGTTPAHGITPSKASWGLKVGGYWSGALQATIDDLSFQRYALKPDEVRTDHAVALGQNLRGGAGNDALIGGFANDLLRGEGGNDTLFGGAGDDTVIGGDGDDWIRGEDGNDWINGGAGNDAVIGGDGNDWIRGELGLDSLNGGLGHDTMMGGDGNDWINGEGGNDQLLGDAGDDTLVGGAGDDYLVGGLGHDLLLAGEGVDTLHGEDGNDTLLGGIGDDLLLGGNGDDWQRGEAGNDSLFGGNGNDTLVGGADNDCLRGDGGNDSLEGNAGNDTLLGGEGQDQLLGGAGNDRLFGGTDNDNISGDAGDDWLRGEDGNDRLFGGTGNDTAIGDAGDDWIRGEAGADSLIGGIGHDSLMGGDDNDWLNGEDGNDRLFGDAGDDTLVGGLGDDYLVGGLGHDVLLAGAGGDTLVGEAGNDKLFGDLGNDLLLGGADDDSLRGEDGNDSLFGGTGNDTLLGGMGNDIVRGDDGDDRLEGNEGDDTMLGGAGQDYLIGGDGNDWMSGGAGADVFVFDDGYDTIADFEDGLDRIDVSGWTPAMIATVSAPGYSQTIGTGSSLILDSGTERLVVVNNSGADMTFTADDFIF